MRARVSTHLWTGPRERAVAALLRRPLVGAVEPAALEALRGALHATSDAVDALAQVDVGAGEVLTPSMVGTRPTVPEGHTVIDVRLGDQQEPFPTGTSIQLASVVGCDEPETTLCTALTQTV